MTSRPGYLEIVEVLRWNEQPSLRHPTLVVAFEGWNDAGEAASGAVAYLASAWRARPFASIDPEEFYDFTATRPQVHLIDGLTRSIEWPQNVLSAAPLPGWERDVILLQGVEPQLRWRTFCTAIADAAAGLQVELVVSLGALLAQVPHTRPVRVTGTAADAELVEKLQLERSRYEGPTGIVGVLHDALGRSGIPSASLWAAVPHYVGETPSPKATLALVERTCELLGTSVDTTDLDLAAAAYERQVSDVVDADEDATAYVRSLELADDSEDEPELEGDDATALADEVERYLREHGQGGGR
jgi:proteasome assembly chaperone (PAC2) family protein